MNDLTLNLVSGLLGALIGAFAGIYAVRHSHVLVAQANLRTLLVAQTLALRMLGSEEMKKQLQMDYLSIFQAYQNLRSVYPWWKRAALDRTWRSYKGNYGDAMPLFGTQTVTTAPNSTSVTGRFFDRDEVLQKLEEFLNCLA